MESESGNDLGMNLVNDGAMSRAALASTLAHEKLDRIIGAAEADVGRTDLDRYVRRRPRLALLLAAATGATLAFALTICRKSPGKITPTHS